LVLGGISIPLADLYRHGLISGVTGSGKTNTARLLADGLSRRGVPVFAVDAKGDFAGISQIERPADPRLPRARGADHGAPPVMLWDLQGRQGRRLDLGSAPRGATRFPECLICADASGAGYISILAASDLIKSAPAYSAFAADLIVQLAERLPQPTPERLGPQFAAVIDEAHLLFRDLQPPTLAKLLRALRRLSSRQAVVIFVAPASSDLPDRLESALGFSIQHALWNCPNRNLERLKRRFCRTESEAAVDVRERVRALGIGEVLISHSRADPALAVQTSLSRGRSGPLTEGERRSIIAETSQAPPWGGADLAISAARRRPISSVGRRTRR
jgi:hypothetical protein